MCEYVCVYKFYLNKPGRKDKSISSDLGLPL